MAETSAQSKRVLVKIVIIGDASVGKTSLIRRYALQKFVTYYTSTIGADFFCKEEVIEDRNVALQLWDTCGAERFQGLGTAFFRASDACIMVFDITNSKSFENLENWYQELIIRADIANPSSFPVVILGNKIDKEKERTVPKIKAEEWCQQKGWKYFETSAKDDINVREAFRHIGILAFEQWKIQPAEEVPVTPPVKSYYETCCNIM